MFIPPEVEVGTTSTGAAGSSAQVTNASSDPSHAVFDFTIPAGATGATGPAGADGADGATGATGATGPVGADGEDEGYGYLARLESKLAEIRGEEVEGEVIEMLAGHADGRTLKGRSGSYQLSTVTAKQTLTATYSSFGLDVDYVPPSGTTTVIYEAVCHVAADVGNDPLLHFMVELDGTRVDPGSTTFRINPHATLSSWLPESSIHLSVALEVNTSSTDLTKARVGAWTGAKTLSWKVREYDNQSHFGASLHSTIVWDGSTQAPNQIFVCPQVKITAIGKKTSYGATGATGAVGAAGAAGAEGEVPSSMLAFMESRIAETGREVFYAAKNADEDISHNTPLDVTGLGNNNAFRHSSAGSSTSLIDYTTGIITIQSNGVYSLNCRVQFLGVNHLFLLRALYRVDSSASWTVFASGLDQVRSVGTNFASRRDHESLQVYKQLSVGNQIKFDATHEHPSGGGTAQRITVRGDPDEDMTVVMGHKLVHINDIPLSIYRPGEIIEMLAGHADGRTLVGNSGSYTLQNITAYQNLTTTHTSIGLDINYIPPPGTKTVLYEAQFQMRGEDPDPILHFQALFDGTAMHPSKSTQAVSYPPTHTTDKIYHLGVAIQLDSSNVDVSQARVGTWNTAKTLQWQAREYNATYEGRLHETILWDGAYVQQFVCPMLKITATA